MLSQNCVVVDFYCSWRGFDHVLESSQGRRGVVVSFMALLELVKAGLLEMVQEKPLAPIYLKPLVTES